jgi:hypothetical protein
LLLFVSCSGARIYLEQEGRRQVIASTLITFERTITCNTLRSSTQRSDDALTSPFENYEVFKAVRVPFTSTLDAHCDYLGVMRFIINKSTVEYIIGGLLLHPDDVEGLTHALALSLFRLNEPEDGDPANPNDLPRDEYIV